MDLLHETIEFWKDSAVKCFETAEILFKNKRYDACLFFCHLAVEKILKGLIVQKQKRAAPYIHDLVELAKLAAIHLSKEQKEHLIIMSTFNIAGRYDSAKLEFYKLCTHEYTKKYFSITAYLIIWLKRKYHRE
ncbi:MAG: HEPN domain-containing protein [Planctomycetes bacterium]|nr:HEPN domain-containing protein [Planctomycetota bacterium]